MGRRGEAGVLPEPNVKQIYLKPRGAFRAPPRSDTLFGLIAHAIRAVYGRASVERFLAPTFEEPAGTPLYVTSAFPYLETERGRLHFFPAPLSHGPAGYVEDAEFLAFVTGQKATADISPLAEGMLRIDRQGHSPVQTLARPGGFFFLAAGSGEHYLEAALKYLERSGFGGGASRGLSQFDAELVDTEFVRLAQPGEYGVLLSLMHPTAEERELIAREARADSRIAYAIERRQGYASAAFVDDVAAAGSGRKSALAMLAEGSVIPRATSRACGAAPVVGTARDSASEFKIVQSGFGFLVPIVAAKVSASEAVA